MDHYGMPTKRVIQIVVSVFGLLQICVHKPGHMTKTVNVYVRNDFGQSQTYSAGHFSECSDFLEMSTALLCFVSTFVAMFDFHIIPSYLWYLLGCMPKLTVEPMFCFDFFRQRLIRTVPFGTIL